MPRRLITPLAAVSSAVLFALPFHFDSFWPAAFVALLPLLAVVDGRGSGEGFKAGFAFGFLHFALVGFWLVLVTPPGTVLVVAYLAIYYACFGAFAGSFLGRPASLGATAHRNALKSILFLPAFWVVLEFLRMIVFTGLPWALAAYGQWKNLAFIQVADLTGAWGVSFLVVFVNVALYQALRALFTAGASLMPEAVDWRRRTAAISAALAAGALVFAYAYGGVTLAAHAPGKAAKQLRVSVVQGNIPQEQKWDARIKNIIFEKYKRLTFMSAVEKSDLIVWPETSFPGYLEDEPLLSAHLRGLVRQSRTEVLVGAPTIGAPEEGGVRFYNSAIHFGADGEEKRRYHKLHLVPFGEYVPFEPVLGIIRHFVHIGAFKAGREATVFTCDTRYQKPNSKVRFAALICFEDIFPDLVRGFVRGGAELLVNVTNDAWFGRTTAPYQHAQASVFRAVENRVPVVRAANTGLSCFIAPTGRILASVEDKGEEIGVTGRKAYDVEIKRPGSLYTRFGEWFVWACFFITFLAYRDKQKHSHYTKL